MASRISKERSKTLQAFRVRKIAADGRCFWYSWISATLFDEWWSVDRNASGYASQRVRMKTEEGMGQALLEEVMGNVMSAAHRSSQTDLYQTVLDRQGSGYNIVRVVTIVYVQIFWPVGPTKLFVAKLVGGYKR